MKGVKPMKGRLFHCTLATLLGIALAALVLCLGMASPVYADPGIHCVNQSGSGCNMGVCGGGCYASVQDAVNAASGGHEIRIAGGAYTSAVGTVAAITKPLMLAGGFTPGLDGHDPGTYRTVLDAQWGGSVISITNAGDVLLEFLTLTHGDGTGNCGARGCGGGIYATGTSLHMGTCVITDNVASTSGGVRGDGGGLYAYAMNHRVDIWDSQILSNTANADPSSSNYSYGGGIYIQYGLASLAESQIMDNVGSTAGTGGYGGGIFLYGLTHADVLTNVIRGNRGAVGAGRSGGGGGLWLLGSVAYVANNRIESNWTNPDHAGDGGGVEISDSEVHLARNTIISNATGTGGYFRPGGGVFVRSSKPVTLSNNLIVHNAASDGGGVFLTSFVPTCQALLVNNTIADNGSGVEAQWHADVTLTNNLIAGHATGLNTMTPFTGTITADHNLFWNTSEPITGTGAILEDPLLTTDYHLGEGSPAIDAGLAIPWLKVDLEGAPRPQGSSYDIGAYEETRWAIYLPLVVRNL
jgi:hypothetical protein